MGGISNPPTCVTDAFVDKDQGVHSRRMPHSMEMGRWLCPEGCGMTQWSLYSVDSHTEWHAKEPDSFCSPADFVTATLKRPKPGLAFQDP